MRTTHFTDSSAIALETDSATVIIFESAADLRTFARTQASPSWTALANTIGCRAVFFGALDDCRSLHARLLVERPDLCLLPEPVIIP